MKNTLGFILIACCGLLVNCGTDEEPIAELSIISTTLNDGAFVSGQQDIPIESEIAFVFSSAIDPNLFETQFSISGGNFDLSYSNGSTKVTISTALDFNTPYNLRIGNEAIGRNGERLAEALNYAFTTATDEVIRSAAPCTSTSGCLRSIEMSGSSGPGTFEFYSNYNIYETNASWGELTEAVIVVHGASHNPDDYFDWMTDTFESEMISESTILIAPFFRNTAGASADDFYWSNTNWRKGQESSNSNKISSFAVIDKLIEQLSDKDLFPVLDKIVVTGHSSGAAFTHVYAGANRAETTQTELEFEYVVANAQFFYYPTDQRINESTNQLFTPNNCSGYTIWPLGFQVTPSYLSGVSSTSFNSQFVSRNVTYLLGNGNQSDPTLNTRDCENTLQGSSRYRRGENMFQFMELVYPDTHNHDRKIVQGIGHDGQGMYQSAEFKTLLEQLLE